MARVARLLALLSLTAYGLRSPSPTHPRHNKRHAHVCAASRGAVDVGGAVAALAAAAALTLGGPAVAENELAALGAKGFDSSLVDTSCFAEGGACGAAAKACLNTGDCRRGMTCTAKCLGDNACITGPRAALVPVANFDQKTLEGTWYKVMGWNDRYDCFDCQKNSFAPAGRDKLAVDVEFSMPRPPAGSYPLRLSEKLVFDQRSAPALSATAAPRRGATRGPRATSPPTTPVPEARARKGLFMPGAASASEVDETGLANDRKPEPVLPKWVRTVGEEVASYLEDPHATERWVFAQQQKMGPGDD
ncbi:VDE lipocalin domain-containing protein [Aureococcus anophagefferens]|nr:VDE lipocalin domain-containing protein [Aureococcus anophagefferens]